MNLRCVYCGKPLPPSDEPPAPGLPREWIAAHARCAGCLEWEAEVLDPKPYRRATAMTTADPAEEFRTRRSRGGITTRVLSVRVYNPQAAAIQTLATEAGVPLNAYLRGLLLSHLEELGRLPEG